MSAQKDEISLLLEPGNVDTQCQETCKQARNASHALAALVALQSFISSTVHPADRFTPAYAEVMAVVEKHTAETRKQILAEHADSLAEAIRQRNRAEITRIHAALSRNGFWQVALQTMRQYNEAELTAAATWAQDWCRETKAKAQAASGFPDALDFRKAGVPVAEYTAMTDISKYLANESI